MTNKSKAPRVHVFEYYRYPGQDWYWTLVAPNGEPIADGCEGYKTRRGVLNAVDRVKIAVPSAEIVEKK